MENINYKNSMPQQHKDAWLKALRSGEYAQDKGLLKTKHGYCCLGVLQMAIDGQVESYTVTDKSGETSQMPLSFLSSTWAAKHNINFAGCGTGPLFYIGDRSDISAAALNDNEDYTFLQIADLIEEQVEGY
jgi:hypothetical protein